MSEDHVHGNLGEVCSSCGTHHRLIESIPDRPLTRSEIDDLGDNDSIEFIRGVSFMFGETLTGMDTDEEATEDLVISTAASTKAVSRHPGTGWVVEQEVDHEDDEDPADVGMEVWMEMSSMMAESMHAAFDE